MVYKFIQVILRIYLPIFFKKIVVRGIENVPTSKPVIFAVNHQNTFMDGILVALKLKKPVFFLTRSDVFKGSLFLKISKRLNLIPIFRKQDGFDDIAQKNKGTFSFCIEELEKGSNVLIFPEGVSEPVHHLFELKKGVARLALEAESKNNFQLDLHVVPVAINYENHFVGGSKVFINYTSPIPISSYQQLCKESESKARNKLLLEIKNRLKSNLIHIEGDYTVFRASHWKKIIQKADSDHEIIKALEALNYEKKIPLKTEGFNWKKEKYRYNQSGSYINKLLAFVICLPGFVAFLPTVFLTRGIVWFVKDESFYLSVVAVSWLFFGLIQFLFCLLYAWNYFDANIVLLLVVCLPFFAFLTLRNFQRVVARD